MLLACWEGKVLLLPLLLQHPAVATASSPLGGRHYTGSLPACEGASSCLRRGWAETSGLLSGKKKQSVSLHSADTVFFFKRKQLCLCRSASRGASLHMSSPAALPADTAAAPSASPGAWPQSPEKWGQNSFSGPPKKQEGVIKRQKRERSAQHLPFQLGKATSSKHADGTLVNIRTCKVDVSNMRATLTRAAPQIPLQGLIQGAAFTLTASRHSGSRGSLQGVLVEGDRGTS